MSSGYIKLYRSLYENEIWRDKPFAKGQAWIDILMLANHSDISGDTGCFERGKVYTTCAFLGERWGWGSRKVLRFLRSLEAEKMVKIEASRTSKNAKKSVHQNAKNRPSNCPSLCPSKGVVITVENYAKFQGGRSRNVHQSDHQSDHQGADFCPSIEQECILNKNNIYIHEQIQEQNLAEEFESLWAIYPNKKGKQNARQKYLKARNEGVTYEAVEEGIKAYAQYIQDNDIEARYVKHGSTFFNQRAWEDNYGHGSKARTADSRDRNGDSEASAEDRLIAALERNAATAGRTKSDHERDF